MVPFRPLWWGSGGWGWPGRILVALSGSGASQAGLEPTEGSALPGEHLTILRPPI